MSDATQAMVRPAGGAPGSTASGPRVPMQNQAPRNMNYEEPKKGKGGKVAAIVIGAIAVIAAAVFFASSLFGGGGKMVTVPNVINYTQEDAEATLQLSLIHIFCTRI